MRGIEIFLVTKEDEKPVYRMELTECEYDEDIEYDIMFIFKRNKEGISLIGKYDERNIIEKKLKCHYKDEIESKINELKEELKLLESSKVEIETVYGI